MTIPASARRLLDRIGQIEAPDTSEVSGFDRVWAGIRAEDRPPRPLTSMTLGEVLDWQDSIDARYPSEAAGRFQFMEDTLRDLVRSGVASPEDRFDAETQYRLAFQLLRRRGWDKFARGMMPVGEFGDQLAKEWASLPVLRGPARGRSFYGGDGLNKALVGADEWESFLRDIQRQAIRESMGDAPERSAECVRAAKPRPKGAAPWNALSALLRALWAILRALFR